MDEIRICNLEVYGHHGVFPEETRLGQKFLINAVLKTSTREAGVTDDLRYSVDYGNACQFMYDFMQKNTFKLIEAAAEKLAAAMLKEYAALKEIELEIKKPWAPIGLPIEMVSVCITRKWHRAYLSIGSNMGDKKDYIDRAIEMMEDDDNFKNIEVSDLIVTAPYGYEEQDDFLNGAVAVDTLYTPHELLDKIHDIEADLGRVREIHWGPRTIDLDIVFYDNEIVEDEDLIIPHPDMENRFFVLQPLSELCPHKIHPVLGKRVSVLKDEVYENEE